MMYENDQNWINQRKLNEITGYVTLRQTHTWGDQSLYDLSLTNPPFEMGLGCGQLRSVKHAQQVNSFFHSVSKIVHIYFSP